MSSKKAKDKGNGQDIPPGSPLGTFIIRAVFDPNAPDGIAVSSERPKNLKMALYMLNRAQDLLVKKLPDELFEQDSRIHKPNVGAVAQFGRR